MWVVLISITIRTKERGKCNFRIGGWTVNHENADCVLYVLEICPIHSSCQFVGGICLHGFMSGVLMGQNVAERVEPGLNSCY